MMPKYRVTLSESERAELESLTSGGTLGVRKAKRALILLAADGAGSTDEEISRTLDVGTSTVYRTKRHFVEDGLEEALNEASRRGADRLLSPKDEAVLIATACSPPPKGRAKWTLSLLGERLVALTELESVSTETIRRRLKEKELKPWQKKMWCIPALDAEFVACMEDVIDLYMEPPDPKRPVVNFDEASMQLVGEARDPIPPKPGEPGKYDSEYVRNGTANIFLQFDQNRGWRHVKVTKHRGNSDFAECMRDLVDDPAYADADVVRIVLDNLNTHRAAALYKSLPPEEARRILRKLEFHYTPKHGSWLNMAEIEIGVMRKQCLDRRIGKVETLTDELEAWENERNCAGATINWLFDLERARKKMKRLYPDISASAEEECAGVSVQEDAMEAAAK
jgi:transposase